MHTHQQRPQQARRKAVAEPAAQRQPRQNRQNNKLRESGNASINLGRIINFFTASKTKYAIGVILFAAAVVCCILCFNYFKYGAADESIAASNSVSGIADSGQPVKNAGGPFGAWLSEVLFVNALGIGSLVLVVYLIVLSCALFGLVKCKFWHFSFICLFTAISISIISGLITYDSASVIHWGGNHGRYVNQWLINMSGVLGAIVVSATLFALLLVIYLDRIIHIYRLVSGKIARKHDDMVAAAAQAKKPDDKVVDVTEDTPKAIDDTPIMTIKTSTVSTGQGQTASRHTSANTEIGFSIDDEQPQTSHTGTPVAATTATSAGAQPEFTIKTAEIGANDTIEPADAVEGQKPFSIRDELSHYKFPGLDLLIDRPVEGVINEQEQEDNKNLIVRTLQEYNIGIASIEATIGPTVTLYEIVPAEGVRIAQIKRLEDDIARSLEALGIRIIAPMPGKGTVGIEVPNRRPQTVSMYTVINSRKFRECKYELPMALGATISNEVYIEDLTKMPHLLVAGATGQGKSVGLNVIIASLLYKKHPGELKFVLIDPKMVEFSLYNRIENHYLAKLPDAEEAVVTEPNEALSTLSALCVEMDQRYELLKKASVRNIKEYNSKFTSHNLNPENGHKFMPYIVVVVDEFADLIMVAGKDISMYIARIAQKARAVGMHMIIATQRPSTDVITGMIKANFPARVAFRVASMVDSKTILDCPGANRLIGRGDMLFSQNSKMERVQCAFIDTPEVEELVNFISRQTGYATPYLLPEPENDKSQTPGAVDLSRRDDKFEDCARFVVQNPTASTSLLQRRFDIGYNKAAKIMDQLQAAGIVGPADGQKPRAVLIDAIALEALLKTL